MDKTKSELMRWIRAKEHKDTLDLHGDLDDVEILEWAEATFGTTIEDHEAEALFTVGQLHDLICAKADLPEEAPCYSARYFRELRRVASAEAGQIHPATPLAELSGEDLKKIQRYSGLKLFTRAHPVGGWAMLAALGLPAVLAVMWNPLWVALYIGTVPAALFLMRISPDALPREINTIGDLVRQTADANVRYFAAQGHKVGQDEAWRMLCDTCKDISGHKRPITRQTTFYA